MGMGLIGGAFSGLGEGLMTGAKMYGDYLSKATLQEEAAKIQAQRDAVLARYRRSDLEYSEEKAGERQGKGFGHAEKLQKGGFAQAEKLQKGGFEHSETLQRQGFGHAETLQKGQQGFTQTENILNRKLQRDLEASRETAAGNRHKQTIGVQMAQLKAAQEKVTLVPQADGSMMKMAPDGRNLGLFQDSEGKVVYGPKDIPKSTQLMMETNNKLIASLTAEMRIAESPEEKAVIRTQMEYYAAANAKLSGTADNSPKWPSPTEAHIDALRSRAKDSNAVRAFDATYGPGAAAKILGGEASGLIGVPLVEEPPGSKPYESDISRRRREERERNEEKRRKYEEMKTEYGDAGY